MGCIQSTWRSTKDYRYRRRALWGDLVNQKSRRSQRERMGCDIDKSGWDVKKVDFARYAFGSFILWNANVQDLLEPKALVYEKKKEESGMTAEEEAELAELMSDDE